MRRHGIGKKAQRIDAYLTYQILQNMAFFAYIFVFIPLLIKTKHNPALLAYIFLWDVSILFGITLYVSIKARRLDVLSAYPVIYVLRWLNAWVFLRSFVEVMILGKFRVADGAWSTAGRRYKSDANLLTA